MRKALNKRLSAFAVAACMAASSLAGLTAYAEDDLTGFEKISLTGKTVTGSASWNNVDTTAAAMAFDGDTSTFFDGEKNGWCQIDLGEICDISLLRFYPRATATDHINRVNGGVFYGSTDGSTWTAIYTVSGVSAAQWYSARPVGSYRYIKYENKTKAANIAEIELYTAVPVKVDLTNKTKSGGSSYNNQNPYGNAFDGSESTFFDGDKGSYCQVDLGALYDVKQIKFYPRDGRVSNKPVSEYVKRLNGGVFYGSTDGSNWTTLYTISGMTTATTDESAVKWYEQNVSGIYRYIKYQNDSYEANIAEIEVYGIFNSDVPAASAEPTEEPTPAPTGEPAPEGFTLLLRTGWSASTNSAQASSGNNSVGMVLDGKTDTIWHSKWSDITNDPETNPVYLQIDMGSEQTISGIRYTPRERNFSSAGTVNGVITAYEVQISTDGSTWTKAGEGNLGYTGSDAQLSKNILFAPVSARYIRLIARGNLNNGSAYVASCAEFDAYSYSGDMAAHPITAARARLDEVKTTINSITTTHEIKAKLLSKVDELGTSGSVDGIESFISATDMIIDALGWMESGIDDVYIGRIMDLLVEKNLSAAAITTANNALSGFYTKGSEVKDDLYIAWQSEFTMSAEEEDMPLYARIASAISRARARIGSNDGNDYIMLKELVSYISGKYDYAGYEYPYGRDAEDAEAVVNNINFALNNLDNNVNTSLATFRSGEIWLDTLGSKISAHGGQIIKQGDTYYWYGEDNKISYPLTTGVSCYSSKDLKNWKYEGLAFKAFDDGTAEKRFTKEFMSDELSGTQGRIERPKVIFNEKTGKYVMWMHLEKDGGYGLSVAGVAVSSSPTGPFVWKWYGSPVYDPYVMVQESYSQTFRDMNLFVDDDKKAYVFYSSENNQTMYEVRLNDDYTWIDDSGLTSAGTTAAEISEGKIITPDMTAITTASYTYGKNSFTRYQLNTGGALSLNKNDDGTYVSRRTDGRMYSPEYADGRWSRVGQNAGSDANRSTEITSTTVNNSCQNQREAPAPIKIGSKYYIVISALSGWRPNPSLTWVADSILGPWSGTGNPMTGSGPAKDELWSFEATPQTSFNSQSTCLLELPNGTYMYMGDRWKNGRYDAGDGGGITGTGADVKASTYVWLPITFETDNTYGDNTLKVRWNGSWTYDYSLSEARDNLMLTGTDPYVMGNLYLPATESGAAVSWSSSDTSAITNTGEVTRGAVDKSVVLTATLTKDGASAQKVFNVTVKAAPAARTDEAYLFVHFKDGTGTSASEQIYFAVSEDGHSWHSVNDGDPVLTSTLGTGGVRDPHIVRSPEGDRFFLIATDLSMYALGGNWNHSGTTTTGSKSIMVWESTDLVNWSEQRMVRVSADNAGNTWAPESIYNRETGAYMVFWASKTDGKQKIYCSETRDFVNFTEPQIYIEKDKDVIDTTIVEENGTYYRFSKDETTGQIMLETSDSLYGTFTKNEDFNVTVRSEGPTCFRLKDGSWELLVDKLSGSGQQAGYTPYITSSLASGLFTADSEYSEPYTFRHGTVIPISKAEYNAIRSRYGISGEAEPETTTEYFSFEGAKGTSYNTVTITASKGTKTATGSADLGTTITLAGEDASIYIAVSDVPEDVEINKITLK